jgi:membrane protease YdiL (CAAX protease family)
VTKQGQGTGSTLPFFFAAFAITWSLQFPAVLAQTGLIPGPMERFMTPLGLGAFGPLLAAMLVSRLQEGKGGLRALFDWLRIWRVGVLWYAVALGLIPALYVSGAAVYFLLGGDGSVRWFYPPQDAARIAAMIVFPIGEEPGWRGFALPRLLQRHSPTAGSLWLGLGWGLWHIPMFIVAGLSAPVMIVSFVNLLAGSFIFTWLFHHTRGSLLLAILLHAGAHLCNPGQVLPANATPFFIYTAAVCFAAVVLLLVDRAAWRRPATLSSIEPLTLER